MRRRFLSNIKSISNDYHSEYFTIEALENGLTAKLSTNACEYRIDDGSWNTLSADTNTPSINKGQTLSFKGNLTPNPDNGIGTFTVSKSFNVEGNIMSLLYGDNFEEQTDLNGKDWAFHRLFKDCTTIVNAQNIILPATILVYRCYSNMFRGCTSLTTTPELPTTTLADYCYYGMFYGCTSLTTAPELPAITLASNCYYSMFSGCTSLVNAPDLPATTLAYACYAYMFYGCSTLNYIKMLATDISASDCLENWVNGVASTGTFVKHPDMTTLPSGDSGIPDGWTVVNTFNNISPCIINQYSESITFIYSDGLFTPTNEIIDLSQHFTKEELLSVQPECEITVTLLDKTDNILASDYVWENDNTLGDVLNELGVTKDVYDINVIITKINAPEDNGYYYYILDETEPFVEKDWMRVVSLEDNNTISLSRDIYYSINGDDWRKLYANNIITVNSDDIVYFKGTNTFNRFTVSKAFNIEGNIMSLLYGDDFEGQTDLSKKNYAFYELFYNCTTLKNAENLILPATTLADYCYQSMFDGCTGLTEAPELPATALASGCYSFMFSGCTSLTTAPELLPATTLASSCYYYMFRDCKSLTEAPELPATALASSCYAYMFYGCKSLTTAPELPATALAEGCYQRMFRGCTSLTTTPELPATTLADYCYQSMFDGCTGLTEAPELPATTLADYCYFGMFYGCKSLTTAPELPATILASQCYHSMFDGCTSLTSAPELPATTLTERCYYEIFEDCSKLNYIKMLATDISASDCLENWVNGVASTGTFVKNAAMTTLPSGNSGIPNGWTVVNA